MNVNLSGRDRPTCTSEAGRSQPADLCAQPKCDHINPTFGLPETFPSLAKNFAVILSETGQTIGNWQS
jgi:hypothetical protein